MRRSRLVDHRGPVGDNIILSELPDCFVSVSLNGWNNIAKLAETGEDYISYPAIHDYNLYNQRHNLRRQWFLAHKTLNLGAIFKIFCMLV